MSKLPAKVEPQADAGHKAESRHPTPNPSPRLRPKPSLNLQPNPDLRSIPAPQTLMNTTLGDILVAGILKDPEDAGRIIADGIAQTKARIDAAKSPSVPKPEL